MSTKCPNEVIPSSYVLPDLNIGSWTLENACTKAADNNTLEVYAAESIEIAGAIVNVFPLLGVHEQGTLMDLTGSGSPVSGGSAVGHDMFNAFDITANTWRSSQVGTNVVTTPSYIGYYFGTEKTLQGKEKYDPPKYIRQQITTIQIQQGANTQNRVIQARIEQSDGEVSANVTFTGTGNGQISDIRQGRFPRASTIYVVANSPNQFTITSSIDGYIGSIGLGVQYGCTDAIFSITPGSIPFVAGDAFTITLSQLWLRSDVVNLPDNGLLNTINVQLCPASPYWRIVPLMFNGGPGDYWEVQKLQMMAYAQTSLDNIQDILFLENRDRDYSSCSIPLKCQWQPNDQMNDMSKFGFSILEQYIFTCSFARMVELIGRPIIIGDVLELTPELQYDHALKPIRKYLEVSECAWAAEGYTPAWKPLLYRFTATHLLPAAENKDIFGTPAEQLYTVDDGTFLQNISNQQSIPLKVSSSIAANVATAVPQTGTDTTDVYTTDTSKAGNLYLEDGLPPNGLPYGEGFELPDITITPDGTYFRLLYASELNIPPRLFKFSLAKNKWMYLETDMRQSYSSMKPSLRNALVSMHQNPINKDITL